LPPWRGFGMINPGLNDTHCQMALTHEIIHERRSCCCPDFILLFSSSHRFRVSVYFLERNYHILATAVACNCSPRTGFSAHAADFNLYVVVLRRNLETAGKISLIIEFLFT